MPNNQNISKVLRSQPVRFLIIGGVNTVLGYSAFALLYWALDELHPVVLAYLAHALVSPLAFFLYRHFVFPGNRPLVSSFLRFQAGYAIPLLLNGPLLFVGVEWLRGNPLVVQGILTVFFVLVTFVINRYFTFRPIY